MNGSRRQAVKESTPDEALTRPSANRLTVGVRWRSWEVGVWLLLWAAPIALPQHAALISEIAILALFALSLDLVLGYAGIVSLGHAAYFGTGAYAAGLFAKHVMPDPLLGLLVGTLAGAALGALTSPMIVRGTDLTRLMVTMGPVAGLFEFDLTARTASFYSLTVLFVAFVLLRRIVHSPFGISLQALRDNRLRLSSLGISVNARLAWVYTAGAALAGSAGALLAQTTGFASLDVLDFHRSADVMLALIIGGAGWLWGGLIGAVAFKVLHDILSSITPQYWTFWIGLFLVMLMLIGRDRLFRPWQWLRSANSNRTDR
jgi:branched-chain amino acid transport system permease protein